MTFKLKAHWEGEVIVLDEPAPPQARTGAPVVVVDIGTPPPTSVEKAQSLSGFARLVLLDPAEEAWEHD